MSRETMIRCNFVVCRFVRAINDLPGRGLYPLFITESEAKSHSESAHGLLVGMMNGAGLGLLSHGQYVKKNPSIIHSRDYLYR